MPSQGVTGTTPILTAIPGLSGTYAWPQVSINAAGQIVKINALTTITGPITINAVSTGITTLTVFGTGTLAAGAAVTVKCSPGGYLAVFSDGTNTSAFMGMNAGGAGQHALQIGCLGTNPFQLYSAGIIGLQVGTGTGSTPWISGYGPTAAGLVDMTPDTGSFTGTVTGVSNTTTGSVTWARIGNLVTLAFPSMLGTSNSASMTVTGLPAEIQPARTQTVPCSVANDGANILAYGQVVANSGTINFVSGVVTVLLGTSYVDFVTGFSTSGQKGPNTTAFSYVLN